MEITKELLAQRIAQLDAREQELFAEINATVGARSEVYDMLAHLEAEPPVVEGAGAPTLEEVV